MLFIICIYFAMAGKLLTFAERGIKKPAYVMTQVILNIKNKWDRPFLKRLYKNMEWTISGQDTTKTSTIAAMRKAEFDEPVSPEEPGPLGPLGAGIALMHTSPLPTPAPSDWQPFRFGGKESLETVGLNLLDFGARMYSPSAMRWTTMDPMAEKYYSVKICVFQPTFLENPPKSLIFDMSL